ncbi:unnamed protein product [Rotaria socialis]|uniref:CoA transferase n=1 Tax=Rotaria socialis TaxID=392032 RepID=A0A818DZB6_9BILA|nr:unnamed protein product [Rotaria socialis]CAF3449906.1 unnamed protein product [Rotaria socialis]CAF3462848.1 unnamed protein product [Rotaria socialis]CAF3504729.1 unnamed protein product [Rotaria socialis]CAF3777382.1 unnamed protein product [Rotaria socialis]
MNPINRLPLQGVKVLDLTRVLAGPFGSMILADYGADVIKVEKPGQGDDTRTWGPPYVEDQSAYFLSINRNKQSIAVDMSRKQGQTIIRELARKSDVVMENYLPGQLKKFGLEYKDLQLINDRLIYCSITGYGSQGPYSRRPGYDLIIQALGGMMSITGSSEPVKVGVAVIDMATGLSSVGAITAALYQREKTGKGTKIECSLLETQLSLLSHIAANYLNGGWEAQRHGTAHASIVPYQAFICQDGERIIVGAANDQFFHELCSIVNLPELTTDDLFKTNKLRVTNRKSLISILSKKFLEKPLAEWIELFQKANKIPYGPINDMKGVFENEQVTFLKQVLEMKNPNRNKPVRIVGPSANFENIEKSAMLRRAAPLLGEHTRSILQTELGYTDENIDKLIQDKIIQ